MENNVNVVKTTAVAGTIAAGVGAAANAGLQKMIFKKPDEFIKTLEGHIESTKKYNNPFFKGTQEAADLANKKLDDVLAKFKDFATSGKIDFKMIAKNALKVGAIGAAFAGFFALLYNLTQKTIRNNAKIAAEELNKVSVNK